MASPSGAEWGCIMKRNKALGVVLVAALSGSLLNGCTSDNAATTATSTTPAPGTSSAAAPPTNPLVGTWVWARRELPEGMFGVLEFRDDGTMTYSAGDTRDTVQVVDTGTYQADEDTLTYLTSSQCDGPTDNATYTYQVSDSWMGPEPGGLHEQERGRQVRGPQDGDGGHPVPDDPMAPDT